MIVVIGPVHRKARPRHPRSDEKAYQPSKKGFARRLREIAQAHPEAERYEIRSQAEARVGQKGRTSYVWWQRGQTLRGLRDVGFQSAWI